MIKLPKGIRAKFLVAWLSWQGSTLVSCDQVDDRKLKFAVIVTKTKGHWVFCRHKERNTPEVPGGYREPGEKILISHSGISA